MAAQPVQITPGVHWLRISIANVYFVRSASGWSLIDTAIPGRAGTIRAAADSLFGAGAKPDAILLTHGHYDHSGSACDLARLWNLPLYVHRSEMPFIDGKITYPLPDPSVGGFMALLSRVFPVRKIDLQGLQRELEDGKPLPGLPDWEPIHTPGHSPGHLAFFRPSDRVLIAGDACTTVNLDSFRDLIANRQKLSRPPAPFTCDWTAAKNSVIALAALDPRIVACGHGTPLTAPDTPAKLRDFARNFPIPAHGRYASQAFVSPR